MKLRISSDWHTEFYTLRGENDLLGMRDCNSKRYLKTMEGEKDQTLILAGDILNSAHIERGDIHKDGIDDLMHTLSDRFKEVFVIAGNHEHYKAEYHTSLEVLRRYYSKFKNFTFGENEFIERDDITFYLGTFWTNFKKSDPFSMGYASTGMNDFRIIRNGAARFTPQDAVDIHEESLKTLKDKMSETNKLVAVTHHAPSFGSTSSKFINSPLNPAFSSDIGLSDLSFNWPGLWIHGHHHDNANYIEGKTQVVANPSGYYDENSNFIKDLVIDFT